MITLQQCIDAWNEQADGFNQWSELDAEERCEWCLRCAGERMDRIRKEQDRDTRHACAEAASKAVMEFAFDGLSYENQEKMADAADMACMNVRAVKE